MEQKHAINDFYRLMSRFKKYNVRIWEQDLSQGEFFMLFQLDQIPRERSDHRPEVSVTDLKMGCGVSMPAVSRMLHSMEKKRYVEFYNCGWDKRSTYIRMTDTGKELLENVQDQMDAFFTRIDARMGKDKVETMMELLFTFVELIEEEIKGLESGKSEFLEKE